MNIEVESWTEEEFLAFKKRVKERNASSRRRIKIMNDFNIDKSEEFIEILNIDIKEDNDYIERNS